MLKIKIAKNEKLNGFIITSIKKTIAKINFAQIKIFKINGHTYGVIHRHIKYILKHKRFLLEQINKQKIRLNLNPKPNLTHSLKKPNLTQRKA